MTSKFSNPGVALEDSSLVKKLLDFVPDKYFSVVFGIEKFHDLKTMSFEEAIVRMKAYEERTTETMVKTLQEARGEVPVIIIVQNGVEEEAVVVEVHCATTVHEALATPVVALVTKVT
ncbi:hypothetical protein V6N13_033579 [Hibiscus sabdariffa]